MKKFHKIVVVGAGTMGNGIAQVFAMHGYGVTLVDIEKRFLDRGLNAIQESLNRFVAKDVISEDEAKGALSSIYTSTDLVRVSSDVDLVIEAVVENEEVKQSVFKQLDASAPREAILASNTSSISITRIADVCKNPDRVIGMHFMNPVPLMKLVEIIKGERTSKETLSVTTSVVESLGKVVGIAEDYPGFLANRILMPMINEAAFALMEGVGTKESIDKVMKLGCNFPMGPLSLADFIGLDVCVNILDVLHEGLGDSKYRCCPLLRRLVVSGKLGRKTGEGFYQY